MAGFKSAKCKGRGSCFVMMVVVGGGMCKCRVRGNKAEIIVIQLYLLNRGVIGWLDADWLI